MAFSRTLVDAAPASNDVGSQSRRLFVTWQEPTTRKISIVGVLTAEPDGRFKFAYVRQAEHVKGFEPFPAFPDLATTYESAELFPFFSNRIMSTKRPEFFQYVQALDLGPDAEHLEILARSAGRRETDTVQIFPEPLVDPTTGRASCLFLVHGIRHVPDAQSRVEALHKGDRLWLRPDPANPKNQLAITVDSRPGEAIGWVPDFLVDFIHALEPDIDQAVVTARRVNGPEVSIQSRVLCGLEAPWPNGNNPFDSVDLQPVSSSSSI